jgi:hypothetical protein
MRQLALAAAVVAAFVSPAAAQAPTAAAPAGSRPAFHTARADSEIRVDGVMEEPAWDRAARIPVLYEYQPGDNVPAPVQTDCFLTYDSKNLYIGCRAMDPRPGEIRAHLMDRDAMDTFVQDDHVGFMLDTFNDERRAFQFRVNPLGVQADAIFSEQDGIEDWSWDTIWASAGRVTAEGYVVEVALPFNQVRFPATAGPQTWGVEFFRSWPRSVRHRMRSHRTDRDKGCILCQEGKLSGLESLTAGRALEFDPTLTGHRTDTREVAPDGEMKTGPATGEAGLTARWGVTPNMIVSGAVNPDFSQVEADVAQLDINTRFALFYPEKRPFFLEGVDYFTTPEQAVFTRTVADPLAGIKLTGKQGRHAVGVFATQDRLNNLILPSNAGSDFATDPGDVTGTVVRYRGDVASRSTAGFLYAGREGGPYHNRVIGPDVMLGLTPSDTVRVQYLRSDTAYPSTIVERYGQPEGAFGGNALSAQYDHVARNWFWTLSYLDRDEDFRADSGFIPRVDLRQAAATVQRRFWGEPKSWFTTFDLVAQSSRTTDHAGRVTDQQLELQALYSGPAQTLLVGLVEVEKEFFEGVTYDKVGGVGLFQVKPSGALALGLTAFAGDAVDYTGNRPADSVMLNPTLEWKVGKPLNLQLNHTFERLTVDGGRLYTANLSQLRAVYHFNVRTFARAILQYTHVARDPSLYPTPTPSRSAELFAQYLFSYKINPQTVLLAGYSDNYASFAGVDLGQTNRTLFLKIGYAWLL